MLMQTFCKKFKIINDFRHIYTERWSRKCVPEFFVSINIVTKKAAWDSTEQFEARPIKWLHVLYVILIVISHAEF